MKRKCDTTGSEKRATKKARKNDNLFVEKFDSSNFYTQKHDPYICNSARNRVVVPGIAGSRLIADYYSTKYGCNIVIMPGYSIFGEDGRELPDLGSNTGDYRKAFLLGMDDIHAIPVIYIKEGDFEGILVSNSLGEGIRTEKIVEQIKKHTGLDVYLTTNPRQADQYSCYTDALIFARDSTALNEVQKNYYIPNLLANLKKHHSNKNNITTLPNELLKTCQISSFLNYHMDKNSNKFIHKKETLTDFRTRYTDTNIETKVDCDSDVTFNDVYSYPRKKGLKFAIIIRIQFYLNQTDMALENILTREEKLDFLSRAKKIVIHSSNLYEAEEKLSRFALVFIRDFQEKTDLSVVCLGVTCQ